MVGHNGYRVVRANNVLKTIVIDYMYIYIYVYIIYILESTRKVVRERKTERWREREE